MLCLSLVQCLLNLLHLMQSRETKNRNKNIKFLLIYCHCNIKDMEYITSMTEDTSNEMILRDALRWTLIERKER